MGTTGNRNVCNSHCMQLLGICFLLVSLHKYGLIAPVMLATPISLVVFMLITNLKAEVGFQMDELFLVNLSGNTTTVVLTQEGDTKYWIVAFSFAALLWVGQITILHTDYGRQRMPYWLLMKTCLLDHTTTAYC